MLSRSQQSTSRWEEYVHYSYEIHTTFMVEHNSSCCILVYMIMIILFILCPYSCAWGEIESRVRNDKVDIARPNCLSIRLYWTSTESMEYVYITHALSCASMSTGDKWRMILKKGAKYDVVYSVVSIKEQTGVIKHCIHFVCGKQILIPTYIPGERFESNGYLPENKRKT